ITPSPPIPARLSARSRTCSAVTSWVPSRSATSTKSFSVPWPLVNVSAPLSVIPHSVPHTRADDVEGAADQRRVVARQPVDPRVRPEPRLLPPREPAGRCDGVRDGLLGREQTVQVRQRLAVAECFACSPALPQTGRVQPAHLVEQARAPH